MGSVAVGSVAVGSVAVDWSVVMGWAPWVGCCGSVAEGQPVISMSRSLGCNCF